MRTFLFMATVCFVTGCHKPPPPAMPPPANVTVSQPIQREVVDWDEFPGRLEAVEMVEVRARVSGYLESIHFTEGAEVKKGDLLFVIDPRPYQAEMDRADAELKRAESRQSLATQEFERSERLLKSKAISQEEADSRTQAKVEAESMLRSAKAAMATVQLNLNFTRITAPISGRISRKMITEGNLVNGNQGQATLLTTIVSMDPIYCYFDADEPSVLKYQRLNREGKLANMNERGVPCELQLANEKDFPHKGVLDFVDNRVDAATGTLKVRGIFPNPGPNRILEPGFFAQIRVPGSGKYDSPLISDKAIGTDQGQKFVYVLNDQQIPDYRQVKPGPLVDGLRVIREGLRTNDWVVVNGLMGIRPGLKVNATRVPMSEADKTKGKP